MRVVVVMANDYPWSVLLDPTELEMTDAKQACKEAMYEKYPDSRPDNFGNNIHNNFRYIHVWDYVCSSFPTRLEADVVELLEAQALKQEHERLEQSYGC